MKNDIIKIASFFFFFLIICKCDSIEENKNFGKCIYMLSESIAINFNHLKTKNDS